MKNSSMINSQFSLNEEMISSFQEKGFLLLKNIFSNSFIDYVSDKINQDLREPTDKYQAGFNRIKFDLFKDDEIINSLLLNYEFRSIMKSLTNETLLYAQGLGFELKKNESKGFPWHIGTQSFGYQKADDFGCTIWTPLAPIQKAKQRGGMAYVSKNMVSGKFMYTHVDPAIFKKLDEKIKNKNDVALDDFVYWRDGPLNDPAMNSILNYYAVEDDFKLGDALIFDKYVIHKSVMLNDGPLDSRAAFVMRFISNNSTYDKKRAEDLEIPRSYFDYSGPTKFHLEVCDQDNDLIRDSYLFKGNLKTLLLE